MQIILSVTVFLLFGLQQGFAFDVSSLISLGESLTKETVCYGKYGCFNRSEASPDWDSQFCQLSGKPEDISVTFYLYTCSNKVIAQVIPYDIPSKKLKKGLVHHGFDPSKRTIFIVHGFNDYFNDYNWMGDIKDTILNLKPCQYNVMVTDWHNGSRTGMDYFSALANTQVVGAVIADLIDQIKDKYHLTNDDFIVMGHSLGSHISGFAGKRLQEPVKLHSIIGMDPAGPGFTHVHTSSRLYYEDASLVLTIHTNAGKSWSNGFGIMEQLGHYNFYPNGGETQPGCQQIDGVAGILLKGLSGMTDAFACSHRRATLLAAYDESRYIDCQSMAYICSSAEDFKTGKCGECKEGTDDCAPFGQWYTYWQSRNGPSANWTKPIKYFVNTNAMLPYSTFHYQIEITTGHNFEQFIGTLGVMVNGGFRNNYREELYIQHTFIPNHNYHVLYESQRNLGPIENIYLQIRDVETSTTDDEPFQMINVEKIKVHYMSAFDEKTRLKMSTVLRAANYQQTVTNSEALQFKAVSNHASPFKSRKSRIHRNKH